jgi:hypothetical protein
MGFAVACARGLPLIKIVIDIPCYLPLGDRARRLALYRLTEKSHLWRLGSIVLKYEKTGLQFKTLKVPRRRQKPIPPHPMEKASAFSLHKVNPPGLKPYGNVGSTHIKRRLAGGKAVLRAGVSRPRVECGSKERRRGAKVPNLGGARATVD